MPVQYGQYDGRKKSVAHVSFASRDSTIASADSMLVSDAVQPIRNHVEGGDVARTLTVSGLIVNTASGMGRTPPKTPKRPAVQRQETKPSNVVSPEVIDKSG